MPTTTLALTSSVIGFISFGITLLTLLGVYRDLISTMRNASTTIPLTLATLRQEIEEERALLRQRCREGDRYHIFPSLRKRHRKQHAVASLLQSTIETIWQEFRNLERPFLIKSAVRAEAVQRGDYWGESDLDDGDGEKPRRRTRRSVPHRGVRDRVDLAEEEKGIPDVQQQRYYRTDFAHRFIWWQSRSAVQSMMDQVQRIQIRRIERDVFEADELVKRCLDQLNGRGGGGGRGRSGSGSPSSGGGGGTSVSRRQVVRSRPGSVRMAASSRRSSAASGHFREMDEREFVRRRPENEASNTGRRRERSPQPRYEYEVVQPGRIFVDVDDGEAPRRPRIVPTRSYSRARDRDR